MYVIFQLADRTCALPRTDVREILPLPNLWRPPGAPDMLAGIVNFDGVATPVISLRALFDVGEPLQDIYQHILLMGNQQTGRHMAFLVDRVLDVTAVPDENLRPVSGAETLNGCVRAEISFAAGGFAHLLAKDRLLIEDERIYLERLRDVAQARRSALDPHDAVE